jgi:hypothetical protein
MPKITQTQIQWFRLRHSGLLAPFDSPEQAAGSLAGIQAQILPAAALALWNRTSGLAFDRFNQLLFDQRTLVKLWGQRGTLHVYASADWPLICGMLSGQRTWWERTGIAAQGSTPAYRALLARVEKLLRQRGTLSRTELRASGLKIDETFFSAWGGIFAALVQRGYACHAGHDSGQGLFAHRAFWLPDLEWNPPSYDEANLELARRYFRAYGPATVQDYAYWRLAPAANVRRWFDALKTELVELDNGAGRALWLLRDDLDALCVRPPARSEWPVKLLYRFDPLLLGIKDKTWLVDAQHYKCVFRPAGHIEGTLLAQGRLQGTWRYDRKDSGLVITFDAFAPLPRRVHLAVAQEALKVAAFFGLPLADLVVKQKV